MELHRNAKLGLSGRLELVRAIERGMTLKAAAAAFSVSPATAHRWWHRWAEASPQERASLRCLYDRSSRPHRCPRLLPADAQARICASRRRSGWGPRLIAGETDDYSWPDFDENTASSLCYTSGTTGNPKGALFSHRSTVLHAFESCRCDGVAISMHDSLCPVVPMFHANAWATPYAAAMSGAKLVFPGAGLYYGSALSEAARYRDQDVCVVGGANSAGQGSLFLSKYARTVTLLVPLTPSTVAVIVASPGPVAVTSPD